MNISPKNTEHALMQSASVNAVLLSLPRRKLK